MSRFYVGQRVRVNYPGSPRHGAEGFIHEVVHGKRIWNPERTAFRVPETSYRVDLQGWGRRADDGLWHAYEARDLIPLDDDSRQLTTWSACAWQPRVVAGERA